MKTYTIENHHLRLTMIGHGATIVSLAYFHEQKWHETSVAYRDPGLFLSNPYYLNCVVGNHAGRIKDGRYIYQGRMYQLDANSKGNHLHGGKDGLSTKEFAVEVLDQCLVFHYADAVLQIKYRFSYRLADQELIIDFSAHPEHPALINITQHMYFNLSGEADIRRHLLMIPARQIHLLDQTGVPDEPVLDVAGTAFDFLRPTLIGTRLDEDHPQFRIHRHIDHPYHTRKQELNLSSPVSHISLAIQADCDYTVIYLSNYFDGTIPFANGPGGRHGAIAIEPQALPNGINIGVDADQIFDRDRPFQRTIHYRFESLK